MEAEEGKNPKGEDGPKGKEVAKEGGEEKSPPRSLQQDDGHSAPPAKIPGARGSTKSRAKNARD